MNELVFHQDHTTQAIEATKVDSASNEDDIPHVVLKNSINNICRDIRTMGTNGLKLIQEIGKKIQDSTKEPRSTSFLIQSISMAVQRGNSASVMGTVENQRSLEKIYYL